MSDDRGELDEAAQWGKALRLLRDDLGFTQEEAAERAGFRTAQGWQRYEYSAPGIFKPAIQRRLTAAIGSTPQALALIRQRLAAEEDGAPQPVRPPASGFADAQQRTYEVLVSPQAPPQDAPARPKFRELGWLFAETTGYVEVVDESLTGYAEPGMIVGYDLGMYPRPGDGCVIELKTGERLIREYVRGDTARIYARCRLPAEEQSWPRAEIRGVYKIKARLD